MKLTNKLIKKIKDIENEVDGINRQIDEDKWIAYEYKNIRRTL